MWKDLIKDFFLFLLFYLFFLILADALQAQDQEQWYLISGTELLKLEQYNQKSEAEKQSWLLQARVLKQDSANLNAQLARAREQNWRLEKSFNKSETDRLTQLSLKNGEIADLKKEVAAEKLEKEEWKGKAAARLIIIIASAALLVLFIAFKVCRFFKLI